MKLTMILTLMLAVVVTAVEYEFVVEEIFDSPSDYLNGLDCRDADGTLIGHSSQGPIFFLDQSNMEQDSTWSGYDGWGVCALPASSGFSLCYNAIGYPPMRISTGNYDHFWTEHSAEAKGHGMDSDLSGNIWEVAYDKKLYKMNLVDSTLVTEMQYVLTEWGTPQGLTCADVYSLGLTNHIFISTTEYVYMYEVIGSALVFVGEIRNPVNNHLSRGLAFSHANQVFYWCYQATEYSDSVKIARLTLQESSVLEPATWASVKAAF